jgi:hypothetical protein
MTVALVRITIALDSAVHFTRQVGSAHAVSESRVFRTMKHQIGEPILTDVTESLEFLTIHQLSHEPTDAHVRHVDGDRLAQVRSVITELQVDRVTVELGSRHRFGPLEAQGGRYRKKCSGARRTRGANHAARVARLVL